MSSKIKALVGESSVVLHYGGAAITIQAATDRLLFEEFKQLIKDGDITVLVDRFLDVKSRIEKYTDKSFYIESQQLFLKNDDRPIPTELAKRLLELEAAGEDFMPLVRFWKNLKQNESEASISQLYGFIKHTNIPITENGYIVTEKGVKQRGGGANIGELVDCWTGTVDNSVGMEVSMPREDVDADPKQTCSRGLHVGAPDFVRNFYRESIIVQCLVNPRDVVSVPIDYNNTKMRVCRYTVIGYSQKAKYKPVYKFSDFINIPSSEEEAIMSRHSKESLSSSGKNKKVVSKKTNHSNVSKRLFNKWFKKFSKMKAKDIVEKVYVEYDVELTHSLKSKSSIVKKAATIAANNEEIDKK